MPGNSWSLGLHVPTNLPIILSYPGHRRQTYLTAITFRGATQIKASYTAVYGKSRPEVLELAQQPGCHPSRGYGGEDQIVGKLIDDLLLLEILFTMVETRAPATLGVTVVMLILATIFVFFRFVTRIWIVRKLYLDDWFILGAWALALGFSVSICAGTAVGLGMHEVDVPQSNHDDLRKAEYAFSVLYNPALMVFCSLPFGSAHLTGIDDQNRHLSLFPLVVQR